RRSPGRSDRTEPCSRRSGSRRWPRPSRRSAPTTARLPPPGTSSAVEHVRRQGASAPWRRDPRAALVGSRSRPLGFVGKATGPRVPGRTDVSDVVWSPSEDYVRRANVTRLMRTHGIDTYDELIRRSQDDIEWFWDAVVKDLGIEFYAPYERVLDGSRGIEWSTWFVGGSINLAHNCVDRWAERTPDRVAILWEGEEGGTARSPTLSSS